MPRIRLDTDLRPVTEFRANAAALIAQVRDTKRPVVLTQRGRGAVVLVDVQEYQKLLEASDRLANGAPSVRRAPALPGPLEPIAVPGGARADAPVEAYKDGVDRSLIRENLRRPVSERLRRLAEMAKFSQSLRNAPRRQARPSTGSPEPPSDQTSS